MQAHANPPHLTETIILNYMALVALGTIKIDAPASMMRRGSSTDSNEWVIEDLPDEEDDDA